MCLKLVFSLLFGVAATRERICRAERADVCHPSSKIRCSHTDGCKRRNDLQQNAAGWMLARHWGMEVAGSNTYV